MLVNMMDILQEAKLKNYAVPQFNINNLEWTKFILEECQKNNSPVILGVSLSSSKYTGGYKTISYMVKNLMEYLNITIPVSLHLDHSNSYEEIVMAIDAGFTSVMLDYSSYSLEDNIKETIRVVEYAHKRNVIVEGEIGAVGGNIAKLYDCIEYVNATRVDILAPAIGNKHGIYKEEPKLNFELLKEISLHLNIPLVLHGGSLIPDDKIKEAINFGISKININTELQLAWTNKVREQLNNDFNVYDPRKIILFGEKAIKEIVQKKLLLMNNISRSR